MTDWTLATVATTSAPTVGIQSASVSASVLTQGNLMVVSVGNHRATGDATYGITDSNGGTWSAVGSVETASKLTAAAFWREAVTADRTNGVVVTLTPSGGSGAYTNSVAELDAFKLPSNGYSLIGIDLSTSTSSIDGGTTQSWSPNTGSSYPNNADALVWTAFYSIGGNGGYSGQNGFTGTTSVNAVPILSANLTILADHFGGSGQASSVAATNVFTNTWNTPVTNSAFFGATFVYSPPPPGGSVSAVAYGPVVVTSPTFTPGIATASVNAYQPTPGVSLHNRAIGSASVDINAYKSAKVASVAVTASVANVTLKGRTATLQAISSPSTLGSAVLGAGLLGGAGGSSGASINGSASATVAVSHPIAYGPLPTLIVTPSGVLAYRSANTYRTTPTYRGVGEGGTILVVGNALAPIANVAANVGVATASVKANSPSLISVAATPGVAAETTTALGTSGIAVTAAYATAAATGFEPVVGISPTPGIAAASVAAYQQQGGVNATTPGVASGSWAAITASVSGSTTTLLGAASIAVTAFTPALQVTSVASVASVATAAYAASVSATIGFTAGVASVTAAAYQPLPSVIVNGGGLVNTNLLATVVADAFVSPVNGGVAPIAGVASVSVNADNLVSSGGPVTGSASVTSAAFVPGSAITAIPTVASVTAAGVSTAEVTPNVASGQWAAYPPSISADNANIIAGIADVEIAAYGTIPTTAVIGPTTASVAGAGFDFAPSTVVVVPGTASVAQAAYPPSTYAAGSTSAQSGVANVVVTAASEMAAVTAGSVGVAKSTVNAYEPIATAQVFVTPQPAVVTLTAFAPASINITAIPDVATGEWAGNDATVAAGPIVTPLPAGVICTAFSSPQVVMPAVGVAAVICDAYNIAQYYNPGAEFTAGLVKTGWVALDVDVGWTASSDFTIWHARLLQETGAV